jgi:hypothetical protein
MGEMVHCEICGRVYSSSHLKAHQRLAHGKALAPQSSVPTSDTEAMQRIVSLFDGLSPKNQKLITKRLSGREKTD